MVGARWVLVSSNYQIEPEVFTITLNSTLSKEMNKFLRISVVLSLSKGNPLVIIINILVQTKDIHIHPMGIQPSSTGVQILVGALIDVHTARVGVSSEAHLAGTVVGPVPVPAVCVGLGIVY